MKKYLPIGSVVLLKEADKKVIIVGLMQNATETETTWDYCALPYPEGIFNSINLSLFNEDQIENIFFIGFQDTEALEFLSGLSSPSGINPN